MEEEIKTKVCTKCGEEKPATEEYFYRKKDGRDGICSWCKTCMKAKASKWGKENARLVGEIQKRWRKKNSEKEKERNRIWYKQNCDKLRESQRRRYEDNIEVNRKIRREYIDSLHDCYVKSRIKSKYGIPTSEIGQGFIEDKREQLQNYRQLKQLLKLKENG